jgi:hypothetical protein
LNAATKNPTQIGIKVAIEFGGFHTIKPIQIETVVKLSKHPDARINGSLRWPTAYAASFTIVLEIDKLTGSQSVTSNDIIVWQIELYK